MTRCTVQSCGDERHVLKGSYSKIKLLVSMPCCRYSACPTKNEDSLSYLERKVLRGSGQCGTQVSSSFRTLPAIPRRQFSAQMSRSCHWPSDDRAPGNSTSGTPFRNAASCPSSRARPRTCAPTRPSHPPARPNGRTLSRARRPPVHTCTGTAA